MVSPTIVGPWRNEQGELIPAGSPAGNDIIGLNRSGAEDTREEPWRLVVYRMVPGAFEGSTEDDENHVTVPRAVTQELKKKLQINEQSMSLPMEAIPEDEAAPNPQGDSPLLLPEERVVDENADPGSDDENQEPPPTVNFTPTADQLRDLEIAHANSGHPSNATTPMGKC